MRTFSPSILLLLALSIFVIEGGHCADSKNAQPTKSEKSDTKSGPASKASKEKGGKAKMAKVTGIGGVFIKSKKDQKALSEWYSKNLGFSLEPWGGAILRWNEDKSEDGGATVWHTVEANSDLFSPAQTSFMINYRVDNMDQMLSQLKANGVSILKGPESHENGKFLWIMDPEGNKVELWEPMIWNDKNKAK